MDRGKKQHSSSGDASIQLGFGEEAVSDEAEKQMGVGHQRMLAVIRRRLHISYLFYIE